MSAKTNHEPIPKDHPVQPLKEGEEPKGKTTCGHCGLSWDDDKPTSLTPVPSARCPFEYFHIHHEKKEQPDPPPNGPFMFVCTNVEKTHEEDKHEEGLDGEVEEQNIDNGVYKAPKLVDLIAKLGNMYDLSMTDLFVREHDQRDGKVLAVTFSHLETAEGVPPTPSQKQKWQKGKLKLFNAEYIFTIEKQYIDGLTEKDFEEAGLKVEVC